MKNKEIKLGIGVLILCVLLFVVLIGIGSLSKKTGPETEHDYTEENTQKSTEVLGTEYESSVTEYESSELTDVEEDSSEIEEYVNFAIADVTDYVNVRQEPNTDSAI